MWVPLLDPLGDEHLTLLRTSLARLLPSTRSGAMVAMPYPGRPGSHDTLPEYEAKARPGARIDPEVRNYIVREYKAGRSLRELAELTGRTHSAVRNVLHRAGVPRRGPGAPAIRQDSDR